MADNNTGAGTGRLAGRKVLITGAASGIGHATAERFAEEGAAIAMLDVKPLGEWLAGPDGAHRFQTNLLDRAAVLATVENAAKAMGGLDGIVNCAAIGGGGKRIDDLDAATWDQVMEINVTAPYLICRAALPYLRQAPGRASIVNIASGAAVLPPSVGSSSYGASKGALVSFTKNLAFDLAPDIRVNAVMPGVVNTPMTMASVIKDYPNPNDAPFVQKYALKRVAEPRELANAILFLLSDEASFVTGATLAADGGRTFH